MRLLLLAALAALVGCDSTFTVDLPDQEPRLVVESLFGADSLLTLRVRQSAPADQSPPSGVVTSATVEVFEDGVRVGTAPYVPARSRYVSAVRPRAGRTYRVRITAPGFGPVEAQDTVPVPVPLDVVSVERGPEPPDDSRQREDAVTVRFQDPPGQDSYALYGIVERAFPGRPDRTQFFPLGFRSADPALADGSFSGLFGEASAPFYTRAVFRSTPFEGQSLTVRLDIVRTAPFGGTVVTERLLLARLSPTYGRYARAISADVGTGPFGDVRRVPSNVEGGYGIFAAFVAVERVLE